MTSLHPPSFHRNDFSTCRFDDRERETDVQRRKGVPQSGNSVEVKAAKGVVP